MIEPLIEHPWLDFLSNVAAPLGKLILIIEALVLGMWIIAGILRAIALLQRTLVSANRHHAERQQLEQLRRQAEMRRLRREIDQG